MSKIFGQVTPPPFCVTICNVSILTVNCHTFDSNVDSLSVDSAEWHMSRLLLLASQVTGSMNVALCLLLSRSCLTALEKHDDANRKYIPD